jgi:hypothetical protein
MPEATEAMMNALLVVLALLGLLLPPSYSVRLALVGLVALLSLPIYSNRPPEEGAGYALGLVFIFSGFLIFIGAIMLGLIARGLWYLIHRGRGSEAEPSPPPPAVDVGLIAIAMFPVAGLVALWLGNALSGSAAPLAVHLTLFAGLAAVAVFSRSLPPLAHGAALGLALWLALIVGDSLRLETQVRADLARLRTDVERACLALGPDRLHLDQVSPLMALTAPKPILLLHGNAGNERVLRWSFRYHGFVRTHINPDVVPCWSPP